MQLPPSIATASVSEYIDRSLERLSDGAARCRSRSCEAPNQLVHELFQFRQRVFGKRQIHVVDMPVLDAIAPVGEAARNKRAVLGFLERDDQISRGKIRLMTMDRLPVRLVEAN